MLSNGELDSRQVSLPERLEQSTVDDVIPGSVWYVDSDAVVVGPDRLMWVNSEAPVRSIQTDWEERPVRIIVFEEGIVVDATASVDEDGNLMQWVAEADSEYFRELKLKPIIGLVTRNQELQDCERILIEKFGYNLAGEIVYPNSNAVTKNKTNKRKQNNKPPKMTISNDTEQSK